MTGDISADTPPDDELLALLWEDARAGGGQGGARDLPNGLGSDRVKTEGSYGVAQCLPTVFQSTFNGSEPVKKFLGISMEFS